MVRQLPINVKKTYTHVQNNLCMTFGLNLKRYSPFPSQMAMAGGVNIHAASFPFPPSINALEIGIRIRIKPDGPSISHTKVETKHAE